MLTTLVLCAGLLLPMAEPEKTVEKTPAAPAKAEKTASAEKTTEKPAERSDGKASADARSADKTSTEKVEKTAEKTPETKKDEPKKDDGKKDEVKKDEDKELLAIEANVISYTNNERARYGLPPLEVDKQLMKTAREHCSWMTWNRIFQHSHRALAENIAMGQPSSQDVVHSWMNSSGHRANILNPNHRHIGVGAYRTESGTIYWVQQFAP